MLHKKVYVAILVIALVLGMMPFTIASPASDDAKDTDVFYTPNNDNKMDPLTEKQLALKEKALERILNGKGVGKVVEVAKGQFVELELEGSKMIWTVLGEFPDLKHNEIPEPNRSMDNSTIWEPDFGRMLLQLS